MVVSSNRAVARCDALKRPPFSEADDMLFRPYLSDAHKATLGQVSLWMEAAGMVVRLDAAGNLIGRYEGQRIPPDYRGETGEAGGGLSGTINPTPRLSAGTSPETKFGDSQIRGGAKTLLIASHIDSVRDGGAYDGPLGVMLGIEVVDALNAAGKVLPFAIEVVAFGDEEGSRFPAAMLCSRSMAGRLEDAALTLGDRDGVTLAAALSNFGLSRFSFLEARRDSSELLGYLEAHIEQGPVLEAENLALGVVTGIAAQRRYEVKVTGIAGHAGTNSMGLRKDALTAAAEMALMIESVGRMGSEDLVATVGRLNVSPNAPNVVPGEVVFTIDVRAGHAAPRDAAATEILFRLEAIAEARGVGCEAHLIHDLPAAPCDPGFSDLLAEAMVENGHPPRRIVSGAGHDAMVFADLTPTAMLFIRCEGGISHNPLEAVTDADVDAALQTMLAFVFKLETRLND